MRSAAIVDLPLPEDPTTATTLPGGRVRLKSFNITYKIIFKQYKLSSKLNCVLRYECIEVEIVRMRWLHWHK